MSDRRKWALDERARGRASRQGEALREAFPGSHRGEALPTSPTGRTARSGVPAVSVRRDAPYGEAITVQTAPGQVFDGGGTACEWVGVRSGIKRAGFSDLAFPTDRLPIPRLAYWRLDVQGGWDTYTRGGTVQVWRASTLLWQDRKPFWTHYARTFDLGVCDPTIDDIRVVVSPVGQPDAQPDGKAGTFTASLVLVEVPLVATQSQVQYWTDFDAGHELGNPPAGWQRVVGEGAKQWEVEARAGATGGTSLRFPSSTESEWEWTGWPGIVGANRLEVVGRVYTLATNDSTGLMIFGNETASRAVGIAIRVDENHLRIFDVTDDPRNLEVRDTHAMTINHETYYWLRGLFQDGTFYGRAWPEGSSEPAGWQVEWTDPDPLTSGIAGVGAGFGTSTGRVVDLVGISAAGAAPMEQP